MLRRRSPTSLPQAAEVLTAQLGTPVSPRTLGLPQAGLAWELCAERPVQLAVLIAGDQGQVVACCGQTHPTPVVFTPSALDATAITELALLSLRMACGEHLYAELAGGGQT